MFVCSPQDIVVPSLVQPHLIKRLGLRHSPLHPLAVVKSEGLPRQNTLFFAGRICGNRGEPNASWPNCGGTQASYSGQVRQKVFYHHYNRSGFVVTTRVEGIEQQMRSTRFCLTSPGSGHSQRQVLVTLLGCVPVVVGE